MTFNEGADISSNRTSRRGRGALIAGGGTIGLGTIVVIVLSLMTGGSFDVGSLLSGGDTSQSAPQETALSECDTGEDANTDDECRLAGGQVALDEFWAERVDGYRAPGNVSVAGSTSTACGTASNQVGPFYCPRDETVYIDTEFFALLRDQYGASAGNLAQLYVLAHEWGHHIQNLTGALAEYSDGRTGPDSNAVRLELQADCYAGAWVGGMTEATDDNGVTYLQAPTRSEIADALNAAATVGDDHIQESAGQVNPETWSHGSSEQRQRWFQTGYSEGVGSCDTFAVDGAEL